MKFCEGPSGRTEKILVVAVENYCTCTCRVVSRIESIQSRAHRVSRTAAFLMSPVILSPFTNWLLNDAYTLLYVYMQCAFGKLPRRRRGTFYRYKLNWKLLQQCFLFEALFNFECNKYFAPSHLQRVRCCLFGRRAFDRPTGGHQTDEHSDAAEKGAHHQWNRRYEVGTSPKYHQLLGLVSRRRSAAGALGVAFIVRLLSRWALKRLAEVQWTVNWNDMFTVQCSTTSSLLYRNMSMSMCSNARRWLWSTSRADRSLM